MKLLNELTVYGVKNTDRVMAFGLALIQLKEDRTTITKKGAYDISIPRFGFKRDSSGIIRRVNN